VVAAGNGGTENHKKKYKLKGKPKTERHDDRVWQVHNAHIIVSFIIYVRGASRSFPEKTVRKSDDIRK